MVLRSPVGSQSKRPLQFDALESRALLSCVLGDGAAVSPNGTLTVEGTLGSDNISVAIQITDPDPNVTGDELTGLVVTRNGATVASCLITDVTGLVIHGGNGNDHITIDDAVLLDTTVDGGNGKDSIDGGGGDDVLHGGNGKDLLDGDAGNDYLDGGNSSDYLQGDLGDDTLSGGNGPDALDDLDSVLNCDGGNGPDTVNGALEQLTGGTGHGHGHGHGHTG